MKTVKIEWVTSERHSGNFNVPDDFDPGNYNIEDALADHDEETFDWLERDNVEVYDQPYNEDHHVLDLEGYRL
jgi:hypothetical protein